MSLLKLRSVVLGAALGFCLLWNGVFVVATIPLMAWVPELLMAWWHDHLPLDYLLLTLGWLAMPCVFIALAIPRLRESRHAELLMLFFAVEGPLCCLGVYRAIAMREVTPAVMQWLLMLAFGLAVHGVAQVWPNLPSRSWRVLKLVATVCLVLVGLYISVLALLGLSPLILAGVFGIFKASTWSSFFRFLGEAQLFAIPVLGLGALVVLSFAGICAMPVCIVWGSLRALFGDWRDRDLPALWRAGAVLGVLALHLAAFHQLNQQPQQTVMAELEAPQGVTPERFASQQSAWRKGLLNAYLSPYRYASSREEANGIAQLYREILHWSDEWAQRPQSVFNALATPILYDGPSTESDSQRAAALYERYFDTPIQRGEREAILRALSATHDRDERESGLINIDQRKVRVTEQRLQLRAEGDLARVTLDETYQNLTDEPQEIFYLFSLPEGAAISKLWLGESPDRLLPHTIATRGAAQRVYKAEVKRNIDPALLEQVGPRQYRLRAYPVPARGFDRRSRAPVEAKKLYLRMEYVTLARGKAWPLPVLAEKRNVGFDADTQRLCDADGAAVCPAKGWLGWWPGPLDAPQAPTAGTHTFTLGAGLSVTARPTTDQPAPPSGRKVLLVVDRSASMQPHRDAVRQALQVARDQMGGNDVSVLLGTTQVMGDAAPRVVPLAQFRDDMLGTFMGGGHVDELLAQAVQHAPGPADLTLVVTDQGAFDLHTGKEGPVPVRPVGMLSFVHVGGVLSPAYDDATLEAVQRSGGSSFTDLPQAWDHFARRLSAAPGFVMARDGYTFTATQGTAEPTADVAVFAPIAARLAVASQTRGGAALSTAQLDRLHAWAKRYDVVTPYSSMLVLVNAQQEQALAKAEAADDRFDRSHEQGVESLRKPDNPLSASVTPEPEEWLLLGVGLVGLVWMVRMRRRQVLGRDVWQVGATS